MRRPEIPRFLRVLAGSALTLGALTLAGLGALRIDAVATGLVRTLAARFSPVGIAVDVARVPRLGLGGMTVAELVVQDSVRGFRIHLDTLRIDFAPTRWRWKRIAVDRVGVVGLRADVRVGGDGPGSTVRPEPEESEGGGNENGWAVLLDDVALRPAASRDPESGDDSFRVRGVAGRLQGLRLSPRPGADAWDLRADFSPPGHPRGWGALAARGDWAGPRLRVDTLDLRSPRSRVSGRLVVPLDSTLARPGGLEWRLEASPLVLADLEGLVPVPAVLAGDSLVLASWSEAVGDSAALRLEAETSAGASARAELRWGRAGTRFGYRGEARIADLDVRRYLGEDGPLGLTSGTLSADGSLVFEGGTVPTLSSSLRASLSAPEAGADLEARVVRGTDAGGETLDSLDLMVRRFRWAEEVQGAGRVAALRDADGVRWEVAVEPRPGGRVSGRGILVGLDAEAGPRWEADLRLDSVLEPRSRSAVSGRVVGEGTGAALPSALTVSLSPSVVAGWSLDTATVTWGAEGTGGRIQGRVAGPLGRANVDAGLGIAEDGGRLELRTLELDSIALPSTADEVAEGPSGALRVTGRVDGTLAWSGPVSEAGDPSRWSGEVDAVLLGIGGPTDITPLDSLTSTLRIEAGRLDGDLRAALPRDGEISLRAAGSVIEPLDLEISDGRFRGVDLSGVVASAPPTRLNGTVSARVRGTPGGGAPSVTGRIELGPSNIREGRLRSLAADVAFTPDEFRGDLVAEIGEGTVDARFEAPARWDGTRWRVEADATLPALGPFFGLPDSAVSLTGRVTAGSDPDAGTRVDVTIGDLRGWGARIDTAAVRGRLAGAVLTVDTVVVRSDIVTADGGGTLPRAVLGLPASVASAVGGRRPAAPASDSSALALTVSIPDSAASLRIGDAQVEVGRGGADLRADCLKDQCELSGELDFGALLLDRWSVLSLQAGVDGSVGPGRRYGPTRTGILVEDIRTPNFDARNATFQTHWDEDDLEVVGTVVVDDRRTAVAEVRIDPAAGALDFRRLDLSFDEDRWNLERPVTFRSDSSGISLDSLVLTSEPQRILARIADEDGARFLFLEVDSLRLGAFSDLLGRPGLGGSASGGLRVRGEGETLTLTGDFGTDLTFEGRPSHRIEVRAEALDGEFTGDLAVLDSLGGRRITGRAEGRIPGVGDGRWDARLELDAVPLGWAEVYGPPDAVQNATGSIHGDVEFRGGPEGVSSRGPVELRNGRLEVPRAAIVLEDVHMAARLDDRTVRLDSAGATSRGRLSLRGSMYVPLEGQPPEIDVQVTADDFLATNTREVEATVTGEVRVEGTLDVPRVQGRLEVPQASYRIPASVTTQRVRDVTLTDQDWAVLRSRFGIVRPDEDQESAWLPRSAVLDLSIALGRDIWLRRDANPELALQFTGDVRVAKSSEDDELELQGSIETIPGRSYVEEFSRRFSVEEGTVTLRGPLDQTRLEVTGEYRVPGSPDEDPVTIRLNVSGGMDRLELALSSEPSLSNGDIVSYLATGRPASSAFSGDGTGSTFGTDILASQLTGALEQFAKEEVGLDVLRIQQEGLHGTTLTAGKYVSPRLFLGFRQGITYQADEGRSLSDDMNSQAEVEYAALDWLVMNIQGGTSAIRFFLEGTYGW